MKAWHLGVVIFEGTLFGWVLTGSQEERRGLKQDPFIGNRGSMTCRAASWWWRLGDPFFVWARDWCLAKRIPVFLQVATGTFLI